MACLDDGPCLACFDLSMKLPVLPDVAKETVAEQLSLQDVCRCLLATRASFSWEFTQYYLSEMKLQLAFWKAVEGLTVVHNLILTLLNVPDTAQTKKLRFKKQFPALESQLILADEKLQHLWRKRQAFQAASLAAGICTRLHREAQEILQLFQDMLQSMAEGVETIRQSATLIY